jgi:replication initiation protein RepC
MGYQAITPFGRTVERVHIRAAEAAKAPLPPTGVDKYEALRELTVARGAFEVTDRALSVLQALLSFHPDRILGGNAERPVVYPSNRALSERLNGMPDSTLRRHLAALVRAGVILRRDSPNGKRYVRRGQEETVAFGFDLSPLAIRHDEIIAAAREARAVQERHRRLREAVSLMRRDLAALAAYGADTRPEAAVWGRYEDQAALTARDLRRRLTDEELERLRGELQAALDEVRPILDPQSSEKMSGSAVIHERHHQNSNKESSDSEPAKKMARTAGVMPEISNLENQAAVDEDRGDSTFERAQRPAFPLYLVLKACPSIVEFGGGEIRHWHDLFNAADQVRPALGISPSAWGEAVRDMGPEEAAVVVGAILQRFSEISSPGGYLRALTRKASNRAFSSGPMVMALLNRGRTREGGRTVA